MRSERCRPASRAIVAVCAAASLSCTAIASGTDGHSFSSTQVTDVENNTRNAATFAAATARAVVTACANTTRSATATATETPNFNNSSGAWFVPRTGRGEFLNIDRTATTEFIRTHFFRRRVGCIPQQQIVVSRVDRRTDIASSSDVRRNGLLKQKRAARVGRCQRSRGGGVNPRVLKLQLLCCVAIVLKCEDRIRKRCKGRRQQSSIGIWYGKNPRRGRRDTR